MEVSDVFRLGAGVFSLVGVGLCVALWLVRLEKMSAERKINLGITTISGIAFFKLLALVALFAVPAATVGVANYHTVVGVHDVDSCNLCHVMTPMITDMRDPHSETLAARHYRHGWIPKDQCYECHSDYGLAGDMRAKMEGYRHLARYTTGTYSEPIEYRGVFSNSNCLKCHSDTPAFRAVSSHVTVAALLKDNTMSCLNCHGAAHPTREQRTPGSPDYDRLMGGAE
jgi:cytochrome c nitrite reductase small subunit